MATVGDVKALIHVIQQYSAYQQYVEKLTGLIAGKLKDTDELPEFQSKIYAKVSAEVSALLEQQKAKAKPLNIAIVKSGGTPTPPPQILTSQPTSSAASVPQKPSAPTRPPPPKPGQGTSPPQSSSPPQQQPASVTPPVSQNPTAPTQPPQTPVQSPVQPASSTTAEPSPSPTTPPAPLSKVQLRDAYTALNSRLGTMSKTGGTYIRDLIKERVSFWTDVVGKNYSNEAQLVASANDRIKDDTKTVDQFGEKSEIHEAFKVLRSKVALIDAASGAHIKKSFAKIETDITKLMNTDFSNHDEVVKWRRAELKDIIEMMKDLVASKEKIPEVENMTDAVLGQKTTDEQLKLLKDVRGARDAGGNFTPKARELQRKIYNAMATSGTHGLESSFEEHEEPIRKKVREKVKQALTTDPVVMAAIKEWDSYGPEMTEDKRRQAMAKVADWTKWETDPALDPAVKADLKKKLAIAQKILKTQCEERGIDPTPSIVFENPSAPVVTGPGRTSTSKGAFSSKTGNIKLNPDPKGAFADFPDLVDTIIHENTHNYQHILVEMLKNETLKPGDKRYKQAQVFAANFADGGYVKPAENATDYEKQPVERHAWQAGGEAKKMGQEVLDLAKGTGA